MRLLEGNSSNFGSEECDVKMKHLEKLEIRQRHYYIAKCVGMTMICDWGMWNGGEVVRCRKSVCSVVKLAVTLSLCAEQQRCSEVKIAVTLYL